MLKSTVRRLLIAGVVAAAASLMLAPAAAADHGEGHNGETLELSKSENLEDGEVVTVTLTSWLPGNTATVVTCYVYPAAGPTDCELSNYGTHTVVIGEDGTGTLEYPVVMVPGRCDATTSCLVVAGDGFGPAANYAAQAFTFAAATAAEPEPTEAPAPTTTAAPPTTAAPTTTAAPPPTAPEPEPVEAAAAPADADSDGGGSVWAWLIPVIIVVAVLALVAGRIARRRAANA